MQATHFQMDATKAEWFRHSLRDRLRAVECPADIIDQIGGWSTSGVGQQYVMDTSGS